MLRTVPIILLAAAVLFAGSAQGADDPVSYHAAIALSVSKGLAGSAFSTSSREEAEQRALTACNCEDAQVLTQVENGWCSLAADANNIYGADWGHTQAEAQSKALARCSQGRSGRIIVSLYSGSDAEPPLKREPATPLEEKMFRRMYGDAGLDAEAMQAVQDGWAAATRREREAQYREFMAKVQDAVQAAVPAGIPVEGPANNQPEPVTGKERKMFEEMYGQIGLDAGTLKTLQDGWENSRSAERKAQYEQFMANVQMAAEGNGPASNRYPREQPSRP